MIRTLFETLEQWGVRRRIFPGIVFRDLDDGLVNSDGHPDGHLRGLSLLAEVPEVFANDGDDIVSQDRVDRQIERTSEGQTGSLWKETTELGDKVDQFSPQGEIPARLFRPEGEDSSSDF